MAIIFPHRGIVKFQSTPPRGWRRYTESELMAAMIISIHSTTRVETDMYRIVLLHSTISIHSTTRVETLCTCTYVRFRGFQSTPPRGWRRRIVFSGPFYPAISIHSTTRVETAILHNNHYYSSTHFHKQIISHPLKSRPTIPLHSQIRSHCANFPVRISP